MDVSVEDAGPCRKVMKVRQSAAEIASEYQAVVAGYAREVKLRGFRKGKAPVDIVERRCAQLIEEDTKERVVPTAYRGALEQEGITPVAIVEVRDVALDKQAGLSFEVVVDVTPEFKLPRYRRIGLKGQKVEVEEKEIDDAISGLRDRMARYEDVEGRPVKDGDLVLIDYRGQIDGQAVSEVASDCSGLGEGTDFWALVGEPEFMPGFREGLVGIAVGEERSIEVTFPPDYHVPAVAGKQAVYQATAKGVREKVLPEFDQAFLKRFEVDTVEALREKAREELQGAADGREKERLKEEISQFLLKKTSVDLPQAIVEQETGLTVRNMMQRFAVQGATREQIDERRDEILSAATRSSEDRVKLSYILNRIADEEAVQVADEDVDLRIAAMAARYGMPAEKFRGELEKRNGVERLRSEVRADKALDFLLENAKIKK